MQTSTKKKPATTSFKGQKMEIETLVAKLIVKPKTKSIYSDLATEISIEDEGAGCFVKVVQCPDNTQTIQIDPEEWPTIKDAIERMVKIAKDQDHQEE